MKKSPYSCQAEISKKGRYEKCGLPATHTDQEGYYICPEHVTIRCKRIGETAFTENLEGELQLGPFIEGERDGF